MELPWVLCSHCTSIPVNSVGAFQFLHSLVNTYLLVFVNSHPSRVLQYLIVVLISFLVMIGDTEQSNILYVFFEEILIQDLGQLFNRIISFVFVFFAIEL